MHQNSKKEIPKTTQVSNWIYEANPWSSTWTLLKRRMFFWLHQLLHPHLDSMIHEELLCKVRRHLKVGLWQKVIYCEYCRCERCESCRDRIECWALGIMGMAVYLQFCNFGVHWICMCCSWMQREHTHTHYLSLSLSLSLLTLWPFYVL